MDIKFCIEAFICITCLIMQEIVFEQYNCKYIISIETGPPLIRRNTDFINYN